MNAASNRSSAVIGTRRFFISLGSSLVVIAVTLFFFAPHLWFMTKIQPGTMEWDRALGFLAQCANPWEPYVEPALRWRLLPPTLAYWLGLRGLTPLALPWIGTITFLTSLHWMLRNRGFSQRANLATLFLVAGSGGVLASLHWFGLNDSWYLLGLAVVTLGHGWRSLVYPCLLCPWIDERFLIALPLAIFSRTLLTPDFPKSAAWSHLLALVARETWPCAIAVLPYAIVRGTFSQLDPELASREFLKTVAREFVIWAPYAPLAWWMGLRAAWLPLAVGLRAVLREAGAPAFVSAALLSLLMLGASLVIAQDMSRTAIILLPGVLGGAIVLARSEAGERTLVVASLVNLLLPAMHVVSTSAEPMYFLPLELWRVFH